MDTKPNVQKGWTEKETDRQISILIMKGMYRDRPLLRNGQAGTLLRLGCAQTGSVDNVYRCTQ